MWVSLVVFVLTLLALFVQDACAVPPVACRSRRESTMRQKFFHVLVKVRVAMLEILAAIGANLLAGALSA